jgi:hypothetical protein
MHLISVLFMCFNLLIVIDLQMICRGKAFVEFSALLNVLLYWCWECGKNV